MRRPEPDSGPAAGDAVARRAWVARAQPWLGTLVEVSLPADDATEARFDAAFAAVAAVHRRMSPHDPASDLARIARAAHRRPVRVDRETAAVLRLALRLSRATGGLFDPTVATRRQRVGARGGIQALRLAPGRRVCTAEPLALDLGGIAKGHAVDRAVAALRAGGARTGLVNAGGDLRVFGAPNWLPLRLRLHGTPTVALPLLEIRDAAVATSADTYRGRAAALLDPHRDRLRPFPGSVTVIAPTCALADALTKVVALSPLRAPRLLSRFGAHAVRIEPDAATLTTTLHSPSPRLRLGPAADA